METIDSLKVDHWVRVLHHERLVKPTLAQVLEVLSPAKGARPKICYRVRLGVDFKSVSGLFSARDEHEVLCDREELEPVQFPPAEEQADYVYGSGKYNMVSFLEKPLEPGQQCMHSGHDNEEPPLAETTIVVNAWGTVVQMPACKVHVSVSGSFLEDAPIGKRWRKEPK